jgi:hypothetical protein
MKEVIKKIVGQELFGFYDYLKHPEYKNSWSGPFNGQEFRRKMFLQIITNFDIKLIVETGTYRGTTTEFMSNNSSAKILTVESNKRYYGFSELRFLFNNKIKTKCDDSRKFLKEILANTNLRSMYILFYLDAHWEEDLPVIEELQIIFNKCEYPIIMIDDFQVPGDKGYEYDDYGTGKTLSIDLLKQLENHKIYCFFPSASSANETGAKRGSIVLTNSTDIKNRLLKLDSLRIFE